MKLNWPSSYCYSGIRWFILHTIPIFTVAAAKVIHNVFNLRKRTLSLDVSLFIAAILLKMFRTGVIWWLNGCNKMGHTELNRVSFKPKK
ncbi:hypothetical protein BDF20DRAFT_898363 [Mycotypha africana]|uniref:uncharacterized protein n=1 Tax=Mycotypha africana TaxID=64632 RepID=UPI0022FFD826|nr:uncharacterized protein BDF20DRAFT_898363 [Mycotypha africana]KAI8968011.1 hypothetical protein BDF20DRAFT_898363 [Mycotypha africana]